MCAPLIIAGMAAGTILKSASTLYAAHNQSEALKNQAFVDDQNAEIASQRAQVEERSGEMDVAKIRAHADQIISQQRVGYAGSGFDVTSGTAGAEQEATAGTGEYMASLARLEGTRKAYGYRSQGIQFAQSAQAKRDAADSALTAGWLTLAGDVIGVASKGGAEGVKAGVF
jgi:hypothetical protein